MGSGSPKLDQPAGARALDPDAATPSAKVGVGVAERVGEENLRKGGGGVKESGQSEDGEGERTHERKERESENKSKSTTTRLRSCMRYSSHNTCVRRSVCTDDNGRTTDLDRLTRHQAAVWRSSATHILTDGSIAGYTAIVPEGDSDTSMDRWSNEKGKYTHLPHDEIEPGSSHKPFAAVWNGKEKHRHGRLRIEMLLSGDNRCRRSRGITERQACLVAGNHAGGWAHYERADGPAESTTPTYSTKCPTALGKQAPTVADKNTANAVEDAIELYVTDMAQRRTLVAEEETTDFEEARMFKHGEEISHGHFRKWRKAIEGKYKEEGIGLPFWCEHLGESTLSKAKWNAALRQSQSFSVCDGDTDTPTRVRFDRYVARDRAAAENAIELARLQPKPGQHTSATDWAEEQQRKRTLHKRIRSLELRSRKLKTVGHSATATVHLIEQKQLTWAERARGETSTTRSASFTVEREGRSRATGPSYRTTGTRKDREGSQDQSTAPDRLAHMATIRRTASGGTEERQKSLDSSLLCTVELDECVFENDVDVFTEAIRKHSPTDGEIVIEDTARYPGLRMHLHKDGKGATFTVDHRVNTWLTRGKEGHSQQIRHVASDLSQTAQRQLHARGGRVAGARGADIARVNQAQSVHPRGPVSAPTPACAERGGEHSPTDHTPGALEKTDSERFNLNGKNKGKDPESMPEFMTPEMYQQIGTNVLLPKHTTKIKGFLERSETACDDTHRFNPSRFDMEHAMRINLKKDCEAPPPEFRKQGHHMLEIIAAQIKEMEDAGWIYRGKSTTACPLLVVRKPTAPGEKQKWRITCDYRELNKVIHNHAYPLPEVTETIRALREQACESHRQDLENGVENPDIPAGVDKNGHDPGVSFISVGDLAKAFYHMPVHPDDRFLTAFNVPGLGTWIYRSAPMGIKTTPSCWTEFLHRKLRRHGCLFEPGMYSAQDVLNVPETRMDDGKPPPHSYLQVYIDDVIIVTASQETHVRAWEHFIKVLEYERLSMTEPKIEIGVKYLRYLGHIVSHSEVFSDPKKVEAIMDMPKPRTKRDCRCWLGCCNYYRPYIVDFGSIARPIIDLTTDRFGKNIAEEWDGDQKYQKAFETLKQKLCSYPILRLPDMSKPYVVVTDASDKGGGAALCQRVDGKLVVIEYASRAWTPAEANYTATEKECLAMKWAAERWRLYLLAAPVTFRVQPDMDKMAEVDLTIPQGAVPMQEPNVTFQTDHSALTSLTRKKQISNQRLAHWVTTMSEFEYTVEYCPGDSKTLDTADCLSRLIKMPSEVTPERKSESARWQYANCWTEVYSKLFDRLKPDDILTVVTTTPRGTDNHGAETPSEAIEGGGGCVVNATASTEAQCHEHAPVTDDSDSCCPSGWDETWEVPGRDDLCDVNLTEDVREYIMEYSEIDDAVANELSMEEGEANNTHLCESFDMPTCFENCFLGEYSQHGQSGTELSPEMHTATVNHMRGITAACPMPIIAGLLANDAPEPCGLQAVCNQHWQREYNSCHEYSYEQCALECTQRDETPPEGHIYNVKAGVGELMGEWYCTDENATLPMVVEHLEEIGHRVSAHDIIVFNQGHPSAEMAKPKDTPFTEGGKDRTYMARDKFKADTYLQLTAHPATQPEDYEDGQLIRDSKVAIAPRVDERRTDVAPLTKTLSKDSYSQKQEANRTPTEKLRKWPATYKEMYRRASARKAVQDKAKLGLAPLFKMRGNAVEVRAKRHSPWLLVIPEEEMQRELVQQAHLEQGSHLHAKAIERTLRRKYWWWTMSAMCREYVDNCIHCQRHKSRVQLPMGKLAEIEEPSSMGIGYSVDFLTRLPEQTAARHTAVMVIRDRWSRRVFAIPCRDTTTAKEAALLFYNEICLNQCRGLPNYVQMDRDPRFRSSWFREFYRLTGVHLHFTTGYKSQSNGLVENANRTLSKLLRSASTDHQLAWFRMLKNAVMTMNMAKQERLGCSPIEAENGVRPRGVLDFDPNLLHEVDGRTAVNPAMTDGQHREAVKAHLDDLLSLQAAIDEQRDSIQEGMMRRYDQRFKELKHMEQGSLVMVEAKHISVPAKKVAGLMECQKLQPRWFGPYRIAAWHNECDIEIERGGRYGLHPRSRVHPVFHVSKVKPFKGDPDKVKMERFGTDETTNDRWVVEAILDHRGRAAEGRRQSTLEYFVQWQGFNAEDYTWEKEKDVIGSGSQAGANELVEAYWNRLQHLESRRVVVEEQTAEPLTEEEIATIARPAQLAYIAQARYELPALLQQGTEEFCKHEFRNGLMPERMSGGDWPEEVFSTTRPDAKTP